MADDFVEGHSNNGNNYQLMKRVPNIMKIKQEIDEDAAQDEFKSRTWRMIQNMKTEGPYDSTDRCQPPTATITSLNQQYFNESTSTNVKDLCDVDFKPNLHSSSGSEFENASDISKEETKTYYLECELIIKKEINTCNVCFKESQEAVCKECVLERERRIDPSYSLDMNDEVNALNTVCKTKVPEKVFTCGICAQTFVMRTDFEQHCMEHIRALQFSCRLCDYKSLHEPGLKEHIRQNHIQELMSRGENVDGFSCAICDYKSVKKDHLRRHLFTHTGEKPFKCDICDFRCSGRGGLKNHVKAKHTNEKNFSCEHCDYKCVTSSQLKQHLRKHTKEKPYKCNLCGFTCPQIGHLSKHLSVKHGNEPNYSCEKCDFKSVTKRQLDRHFLNHDRQRVYKCELCTYASFHQISLNKHMNTKHTGKNYWCDMCDYKCISRHGLVRHIRTHTGEKPYICNLCGYRSSQIGYLNVHLKAKHKNENNYSCDKCDYKCFSKSMLTRHRNTLHCA